MTFFKWLPLVVLLLSSRTAMTETSFLYNPGPTRLAGYILTTNGSGAQCTTNQAYEGAADGNPAGWCSNGLACVNSTTWLASDGSCPSYYHDSTVGWTYAEKDNYPGWAIWQLSGGYGNPVEYKYLNYAHTVSDPCTLREVGLVYHKWSLTERAHCFKVHSDGSPLKLGEYDDVLARFRAKLGYTYGPPACDSYPTAFVTTDIRVVYADSSGAVVRTDLLGIHLWEMEDSLTGDPVMWEDGGQTSTSWRRQLSGDYIGVPQLVTTTFTDYEWDVKSLLSTYLPPPSGYTIDDAIPVGLDIYASVRGADIDFTVREVDLVGL